MVCMVSFLLHTSWSVTTGNKVIAPRIVSSLLESLLNKRGLYASREAYGHHSVLKCHLMETFSMKIQVYLFLTLADHCGVHWWGGNNSFLWGDDNFCFWPHMHHMQVAYGGMCPALLAWISVKGTSPIPESQCTEIQRAFSCKKKYKRQWTKMLNPSKLMFLSFSL